ncbi:MAG: hypothetical protein CMJ72_02015 [Planctomycetaceae bacterium]|nr:hypothetical protein [Planctomycetaceae bacterium]HCK40000.1 hypothetical protein [Planctomycetaceae bacterium]
MNALRFLVFFCLALIPINVSAQNNEALQQAARIRQIVLSQGKSPATVAHLVQLTRDLPPADAAPLYEQIANDYLAAGKHDQAAEVLHQLVDQYPDQRATQAGLLTLARLYTSSEVVQIQASKPVSTPEELATYALHLAGQARHKQTKLADDPEHTFQSAVAARRSGRLKLAQSFLSLLKHNPRMQPWHRRAQAEQWLIEARQDEEAPLTIRRCTPVERRPHLDGQLQEPCWQLETSSAPSKTTQAWFAKDEEFLYMAVHCKKMPQTQYEVDPRARTYDADLSTHDHVRIHLDLDRDYATSFELSVDHRGWTADRCWLTPGWNPRWFVISAQNATHWTLEGAIPWSELGAPPLAETAWAIAVERKVPGFDVVPVAFGLLLFE